MGCPWDDRACCYHAAINGRGDIVLWIMQNGYWWGDWGFECECGSNYFNISDLTEQNYIQRCSKNQCRWDSCMWNFAAKGDYLEIIEWMIKDGYEWDEPRLYHLAVKNHSSSILAWLYRRHATLALEKLNEMIVLDDVYTMSEYCDTQRD